MLRKVRWVMRLHINTRALWGLALGMVLGAAVSLGQTFEVVHSFTPSEGSDPQSGLIQLPDGKFIGTTVGDFGTIFEMDATGKVTTLHRFDWSRDGANPHAPLCIGPGGSLYGTVLNGLLGWGGIYELEDDMGVAVLKAFVPLEGANPHAPLIWVPDKVTGNSYYGVTTSGGNGGVGTIFVMDAMDNVRTLYHFSGVDGARPFESLTYFKGFLYGTTTVGGRSNMGTIFRIGVGGSSLQSGSFQVLYSFSGTDGAKPEAPLIVVNGMLYGTTSQGGPHKAGTVFQYDLLYQKLTVLHNFDGSDGTTPHAGLVLAHDGYLYGTTAEGGSVRADVPTPGGTVFRIHPYLKYFDVIHRFNTWDGSNSQSRLIVGQDGALYGTTAAGGADNLGVVFRLVFAKVGSTKDSALP
jgi:uncharacterized repeat protein (TIGR03803 family)